MNEENKNSITYDEGWKSIADREYPQLVSTGNEELDGEYNSEEENNVPEKKKDGPKQLLITLQLVLCIIAALAAFVLKSIGGEIYETARNWYYTNLNSSAIFDDSQKFNFEGIFGAATQDEAENT